MTLHPPTATDDQHAQLKEVQIHLGQPQDKNSYYLKKPQCHT